MTEATLKNMQYEFLKPADNLVELVWGGSYIEQMKGIPPSGRNIGESWECSTHILHPSHILISDGSETTLDDLLALKGKAILGKGINKEFNSTLPLLVKFIDAREDLSVQVHPSDKRATELGESDTGKDESWIVLDAEEGAVLYLGFKEDVDKEEFEKDIRSSDVNLAEKYLNAIPVRKGDVLFNPAGTVHAIGKGIVLAEIQQSSGVTYRLWDWNRVPQRELHVEKALSVLDFSGKTKQDFLRVPRRLSDKEERILDTFHFSVDRVTLRPGEHICLETMEAFQELTCLEGKATLEAERSREEISIGQSLLVPAAVGSYKITSADGVVLLKSFLTVPQHIDPVIFQTYDVRAVADEYLSDRIVYYLGKGYGTFLRRLNKAPSSRLWVAVGGGVRLSTERIRTWLIKGILASGVNVYNVGVTSTPDLYFAIPYLEADGGINITASHNESEYNGLKQLVKSRDGFITSINAEQMLQLKETVLRGDFLDGDGKCICIAEGEISKHHNQFVEANCRLGRHIWVYLMEKWKKKGLKAHLDTIEQAQFPPYPNEQSWKEIRDVLGLPARFVQPDTAVQHPLNGLKVVIDFGNGSSWRTAEVYSNLGAEVISLNGDPDGAFPGHTPDPIKAKYRGELEAAVKAATINCEKEVVGIGHDEDGDRVIYVRSDGKVVEGDRSLAIQAKAIIEEYKKTGKEGKPRFMGEVKFSRIAEEFVTENGGEYIMSPTGFAFIKDGTRGVYRAISDGLPEANLFGNKIDLRQNREPVVLAAELSGHQMSGHEENWIFDDGTLAAVKILTVIASSARQGQTFIDLDEEVPRYPATPELNVKLPTNVLSEKGEVVDKVVSIYRKKGNPIDTTDGGLIEWNDGQGRWIGQALVRKSNTQPMLICRVEGKDEQTKEMIENEFFSELSHVSTQAVPKLDLASDDYIRGILPRI